MERRPFHLCSCYVLPMRHRGTRRTRRHFSELEFMALLRALGEAWTACRSAMAAAPIGGDACKAARAVTDPIDAASEILTGKPRPRTPRPHGRPDDSKPQPAPGQTSPALQSATTRCSGAELYVSYVGGKEQDDDLRDLAAKVTATALALPCSKRVK